MATQNYDNLLDRAVKNLPKKVTTKERFEIPKAKGHIQGNKTIVNNFKEISDTLARDPQLLLKYLQRELASPAQIEGPRLILGRKMSSNLINSKIEQFTKEMVLCTECGKPDTKLTKEGRTLIIKCMVCGAQHPIKSKI
tara:strand:- start:30763 stop:31179 length:417 start_codon:yes stop_codon:yes gene_type:complete